MQWIVLRNKTEWQYSLKTVIVGHDYYVIKFCNFICNKIITNNFNKIIQNIKTCNYHLGGKTHTYTMIANDPIFYLQDCC